MFVRLSRRTHKALAQVAELVAARADARARSNFAEADVCRDALRVRAHGRIYVSAIA